MTCRHGYLDPECSSYPQHKQEEEDKQLLARVKAAGMTINSFSTDTPDTSRYQVFKVVRAGKHLIMEVIYPNCEKCSYEGHKLMVFLDVTEEQALRWRKIDPHFRDPDRVLPEEAPPPSARFPATDGGWRDAAVYAETKRK